MGGGSPTVLDCMWRNFPQSRGQDPSVDAGQLETFCTSEWPTFGVGWPPEGTLNLGISQAVHLQGGQVTQTNLSTETVGRN